MANETCFENDFQPHRRIVLEYEFGESSTFSYLMGNTKPIYIDMTSCKISPVRCLFLGSGDLRNILYLIHSSPTVTEWKFDLVDNNPSIVARNLLFLQILNDETISVDVLWNIWYDFVLTKDVYTYLQDLIQKLSISNLELIHEIGRSTIAKVYEEWLTLFESIIKEKACKQRHDHLLYCFERICTMTFDEYIKLACESVLSVIGNENQTTIDEAKKEVKRYIEDGTTGLTNNQDYINITMLQSSSGMYTGHYGMFPYQGYIPFETIEEKEEFHKIIHRNLNPLMKYCKHKLEQWVKTYRQRRQKIKWHFWYGDALNLALFYMPLIEFDLIHTSNLCDHISMFNLLIICINLLRHKPWSRILTQNMAWRTIYVHFTDYILQLFNNVSIGWFPSLLGLICECTRTIRLDQDKVMAKVSLIDSYEYQIWRLAINVQVEPCLRLDGTDTNVLEVLDKLAERCFYTHLTKSDAFEGTGHCTTLTYYLLLRQYCLRCCIQPDESFEYLFERTCDRFRAYATGLHTLRDFFSKNNVDMFTSNDHMLSKMDTFLPVQVHTPVLQIVIIECDEKTMHTLLNTMRTDTFKQTTRTSVTGDEISYNLCTGTMMLLSDPQRQIKFHLIDDFIFKLTMKSAQIKDTLPNFYINLAHNSQVQFILPTSFSPLFQTAFLIDAHTWFPFAQFRLTNPITICSKLATEALAIRDAVSSCYADISDRKIYRTKVNKNVSTIQIANAYETTSSFHVLIKIQTQQSSWTHTQNLILSGHVLILKIQFAHLDVCLLRLVFACPVDLHQSKFQANKENGTLNMSLAKNIAELLSLTTFTRESNNVLFDSRTAKRWPPPQLANGRPLDIGLTFPDPSVVGNYDSETMIVYQALTDMFTLSEMQLVQRQSGDHLYRDADFDLRESIRNMYLQAFCGRQRVALYCRNAGRSLVLTDFRTCGDILFLYEGIYNYCGRPTLAISYLNMIEIPDANVVSLTEDIKNLIRTELSKYASNGNVLEINASKEELDLMRQLLSQNRTKTKGTHRDGLRGPWHASFVELLRLDSRSLLLSTKLTRDSGVNLESVACNLFQCQVCKKMPPDPSKLWPKCSQCKKVSYCSTKCQEQDWPNHKKTCTLKK